jgi:hypothetical protein
VSRKTVVIPPGSCVSVQGSLKTKAPHEFLIMTEPETFPQLPAGLVHTPSLHSVDFSVGSTQHLDVEIVNFTQHEITLPSNSVLCGVHQAKVVCTAQCSQLGKSDYSYQGSSDEFLQQFVHSPTLSESEKTAVDKLLFK